MIHKATDVFPPHLDLSLNSLPLKMDGEWVSTRCETRSYSLFLSRHLSFLDYKNAWNGLYTYFSDPKCQKPVFSLTVRGQYELGNVLDVVNGAKNVDFSVDDIIVTPHTSGMVTSLNGHVNNTCAKRGSWKLDVPQDITATGGCSGLGLKIPSREFQIAKLEMDINGNYLLYLGQINNEMSSKNGRNANGRPTFYQSPLMQCDAHIRRYDGVNSLSPFPDMSIMSSRLYVSLNNGECFRVNQMLLYALSFWILWLFLLGL